MNRKKIKIGLLGCGIVGQSVYKLLQMNSDKYKTILHNTTLEITKILVSDPDKKRLDIPSEIITMNVEDILEDSSIDIVIEVIGGITKAKKYIEKALENGKHIITANKDLMAIAAQEILELGNKVGKQIRYEASIAGAIPIVSTVRENVLSNKISKVMGIISGTTNFILTKMFNDGKDLMEVLKEAQELGYAEADPTSDIEGLDAARKIAVLASIAFNRSVVLDDVYVEGITKISIDDINYAKMFNSTIKLLGIAVDDEQGIEVRVHPTLLPLSHPLAKVDDVYNAVYIEGNAFGDLTLIGKGAGGLPTASAVVADLLAVVKDINSNNTNYNNRFCYLNTPIKKIEDILNHYYIRIIVLDKTRVLSKITETFADNNVSIDSAIQKKLEGNLAELVILTDKVLNKNMLKAKEQIASLEVVKEIKSLIRSEKEY